ncbi:type I toxin-antitoxin system Fst family toxin [Streptococcus pasteurianus]|nr:type I toxin-antitoxin system Fst family toxin [Streptococcus pasteurianus]
MLLLAFTTLIAPVVTGLVIALFEHWLNKHDK